MASQVQIRPEPTDHYLCHPNIMPDYEYFESLYVNKFLGARQCHEFGESGNISCRFSIQFGAAPALRLASKFAP